MKTQRRSDIDVAMARLAAARPPAAERPEALVTPAERARLLADVVGTDAGTDAGTGAGTARRAASIGGADRTWGDGPVPARSRRRRRVLGAALVAATVAAGFGVAALVTPRDDTAQVSAGPGESRLPSLHPSDEARFVLGALPAGVELQQLSVEPVAAPPGMPFAEVYGRRGPDGQVRQAVAVLTATDAAAFESLVSNSGAASRPVAGQPGQLDYDLGSGLLARSWASEDGVQVLVFARGLDGGSAGLGAVVADVVVSAADEPGDRIEAPALVADGFELVYQGTGVPGLTAGSRTALRYSDDGGERGITLWLDEGFDFEPAALTWMYPENRAVEVGGHQGLLVSDGVLTAVLWSERPGLILSVDVSGFSQDDAVRFANSVREVDEGEWAETVDALAGDPGSS